MAILDWNTYKEAYEEIQQRMFRLKIQKEKLTKLLEGNQIVNLEEIEADESVKEDIVKNTNSLINEIV